MMASLKKAAQVAVLLPALFAAAYGASNETASSTFANDDTQMIWSVNSAPNSNDLNFYLSAPNFYSWVGIGFGSKMADSLMLIFYTAGNGVDMTISPRLGTADGEPPYYPHITLTKDETTSQISNGTYYARGTCHNCTSWPGGSLDLSSPTAHFSFAVGTAGITLATDDLSAPLKRHIGYGVFTMDMAQARGSGGAPLNPPAQNDGASLVGSITQDSDNLHTAHGVVMVVAVIGAAPVDAIAANLLRKWPVLHIITSIGYFSIVIVGMAIGIIVSKEYIVTRGFMTGHQILGFVTVALMLIVALMGVTHRMIARSARKRDQAPPEKADLFRKVHLWSGRLIWVLLVVNAGVGLNLDQVGTSLKIGFAALAVGVILVLAPLYFCVFWILRRKEEAKEEEQSSAYQLSQLYVEH